MTDFTKKFPIAERFVELQGEGVYTGVLMQFIRLAGCTVGKPFPKQMYVGSTVSEHEHPILEGTIKTRSDQGLPIYTEKCTLWDGRTFACDTDYRKKESMTLGEIIESIPSDIEHVCLTGGEPLMHDVQDLVRELARYKMVHIETSGTIDWNKAIGYITLDNVRSEIWLTVAPKLGALPRMIKAADEIKLLVDENFDPNSVPEEVKNHEVVYLQPVNGEFQVSRENLQLARAAQRQHPRWRLSLQLHKVLSEILQERVR